MGFGSDGLLAETSCTHAHLGFHERLKLLIACWKISFMYHAFSGHRAWMAGSTNASSRNWWSEAKKCVSCRDSLLVNPSRYFDLSSRKPNDEAVIGKACARFNNLARGIDYAIISYNSRVSWCFGKVLKVIFLFFFFDILSLELVIVHGSITKKLKESLFKPLPPNR